MEKEEAAKILKEKLDTLSQLIIKFEKDINNVKQKKSALEEVYFEVSGEKYTQPAVDPQFKLPFMGEIRLPKGFIKDLLNEILSNSEPLSMKEIIAIIKEAKGPIENIKSFESSVYMSLKRGIEAGEIERKGSRGNYKYFLPKTID